jgi:uncharacterized protein (DUF1778 family)
MERRCTTSTRLTPAEHDLVARAAAGIGLGISQFLRQSALAVASRSLQAPAVFVKDARGRRARVALYRTQEGAP